MSESRNRTSAEMVFAMWFFFCDFFSWNFSVCNSPKPFYLLNVDWRGSFRYVSSAQIIWSGHRLVTYISTYIWVALYTYTIYTTIGDEYSTYYIYQNNTTYIIDLSAYPKKRSSNSEPVNEIVTSGKMQEKCLGHILFYLLNPNTSIFHINNDILI